MPAHYPPEAIVQYYKEVQTPLYIGIEGYIFNKEMEQLLKTVKPTGIVLLGSNIQSFEQTKTLVKDIHNYAKKRGVSIKVSIDEEGGLVSRLNKIKGYPKEFKGLRAYSETGADKQLKLLKDIGIDLNLAPVLDISYTENSIMKLRSAGDTPDKVIDITSKYINLSRKYNIENTAKHFPGLGRTTTDTHWEKATVEIDYKEWLESDAVPYKSAIKNNVEHIMFGHVRYPKIDERTSTVSSKWVEILRNELNFKGNIITDDLKMLAISDEVFTFNCNDKSLTSDTHPLSTIIKKVLDIGINNPLLILTTQDTLDVHNEWLRIEKECIYKYNEKTVEKN